MKKLFGLLAFLFIFSSVAFADFDCRINGATCNSNPITGLDFQMATGNSLAAQTGLRKKIAVADSNLFAAGVAQGDYTSIPSTTNALPVGYAFLRMAMSNDSAFQAKTLANGYPGQMLIIENTGLTNAGSGGSFTITPTTSTGWSSLISNKAQDTVHLLYIDTAIGWIIISTDNLSATSGISIVDAGGK